MSVKRYRPTINVLTGLTILFMGMVGLVLALITGSMYRQVTLESQQQALHELVRLRAADLVKGMEIGSRNLGSHLLGQPEFIQAIERRNTTKLSGMLKDLADRPPAAVSDIEVINLIVYGRSFNHMAELVGEVADGQPYVLCVDQLNVARQRTGLDRMQVMSGLCKIGLHIYHSVLMPIGGFSLTGYLVVITDPVKSLLPIQETLGMPIRIQSMDQQQEFYRSPDWNEPQGFLTTNSVTEYRLLAIDGNTGLHISVAQHAGTLTEQLVHTRKTVMLAAAGMTLFAILIALWIIRRTTVRPLQQLTGQLHRLQGNRDEIGRQIEVRGTREIEELAGGFNSMTTELNNMYDKLEDLAFTDALTRLPNRYQLHQRLEGFTNDNRNSHRHFSLFLMDLDRFKLVNDTLGHHVGDQLLQQVGLRLPYVLRDSDVVTRLDSASRAAFEDDMVARLGGDEFAVILPDTQTQEQAEIVARKIIDAMDEPFVVDGHTLSVGISIGIALFPTDGDDMHTLMRKADVAMYYAKKNRLGYILYMEGQEETVMDTRQAS